MAEPITTTALVMQAGSSIAGGLSAFGQARGERQRAEANAAIGETRAMQTATTMMQETGSELATLRATLAANGQGLDVGTMPFFQELRRVRGRESRIAVANERAGAADWRMQGRAAGAQGTAALLSGILGAGPSLFDLYQLRAPAPSTAPMRPQARPW